MLAALSACACGGIGIAAGRTLKLREKRLDVWLQALVALRGNLTRLRLPLKDALRASAGESTESLRLLAASLDARPDESLRQALSRLPRDELLKENEREALHAGLASLDIADARGQEESLTLAEARFSDFLRAARETRREKAKLYTSLGWLAGAGVFLILI